MKNAISLTERTNNNINSEQLLAWAKDALEQDEFIVVYQPKYDIRSLNTTGAEALVRWVRPNGQIISPADFIPLFEEHGYIIHLDFLVLKKVCQMLSESLRQDILPDPVSVNFSRLHIYNPQFAEQVNQVSCQYGVSAGLIEIEFTESVSIDDPSLFNRLIERLHFYGYTVAMDDFGTGFSSLNLLMDIPVDVLKLDRGFLKLTAENKARAICIIRSLVQLSRALGIMIIAEGVETAQEMEVLRQCGCNVGQGYFFSKPVPEEVYVTLLSELIAV